MYQPKKYKKQDPPYIFEFIKKHPFATLIIQGEELLATHIPILLNGDPEKFELFGHIANHNEMYSVLKDGVKVLLIFNGAHGYVSSSWYQEKDISTWDYSAVHISATIKIQTKEELENSLKLLVNHFEKKQKKPLWYKQIPASLLEEHLPLITGFWLHPFQIKAIAKHHQGSSEENKKEVVNNLKENGNSELAKAIENENS
jgi:transcriptional regulator